jgi:hypothetical protein
LCATGITASEVVCDGDEPRMVRCETFAPDEWWTPCDAPVGCSATAHVCGVAEYVASSRGPVGQPAWIDACLRDGGDVFATPREGRCESCDGDTTPPTPAVAGFNCETGSGTDPGLSHVGVRADGSCWEIGTDRVRGYWAPYGVTSTVKSVMCCP